MKPHIPDAGAGDVAPLQVLWEDGERVFCRVSGDDAGGERRTFMAVVPATEHPSTISLDRLAHEFGLKDHLDGPWAVRPLDLVRDRGRTMLMLDDPGAEPLQRLLGAPMELSRFLRLAAALAAALRGLHERGLIHKDINPANLLVDAATNQVWLTGFGVASRLPRERQAPTPPEFIAGSLPYMAPEQTGRMNRSINSRSDLYSLGVTLYEMSTGRLPFTASDPMEWVHCQIARQPVPPRERVSDIPGPVSAIIMKLLAKTAEERYQTAVGLERDLQRCLEEWQTHGRIGAFRLGQDDLPDRLLIPEKLYGRSREVAALLDTFQNVVATGAPELVLVSGYSGIGKSSVVNELHKVLVPPRGLFAAGKFDQHKRDIPYATVAQAFQGLVRQILGKSEAELQRWRAALGEALGSNGRLIVDLIPELELIIGQPPPVADLPPQEAKRRFQAVLRRFIGVFARPEHPLALFLDDLQWLDPATLDLLEDLLTGGDIRHLLLIGAYRDNEVDAAHPLMRRLEAIRRTAAPVRNIVLAPLGYRDLGQLIGDALHCKQEHARPLVQIIDEKTGGNPFFATQFLHALADEALLAFDHAEKRWSWDLARIHAKRYTDNVIDLMIAKLGRLPAETLAVLRQFACVGFRADFALLATVCQTSPAELHDRIWEAVRAGLVLRLEDSYAFQHDRIQEAAYSLIPEDSRAEAHLRIGRLLLAHTPADKHEEVIFEIVSQFNRSLALITSQDEREQLAELNLVAGKRAQASSAYMAALNYLTAGAALLTENSWQQRRELRFALELARAHCELAAGMIAEAEQRLHSLSIRAVTTAERAAVTCLQVDLYEGSGRTAEAVAVGLRALRQVGVDFPERPTEADARRAYDSIWTRLGARAIEDLIHLPVMSDPDSLAALDLLMRISLPAHYLDAHHLYSVAICRAVSLGLEQGHSEASCAAYAALGTIAGPKFGQFDAGYRFAQLGCELAERPGWQRFQVRTFAVFGFIAPWTQHVRKGREFLSRAFDLGSRIGDISSAGYACGALTSNDLAAGAPLIETQGQAEHGLAVIRKIGFTTLEGWFLGQLGLIRSLRGLTTRLGCFDDAASRETDIEHDLAGKRALALPECWYYIRKLQARFLAGEYAGALQAASRAQPMIGSTHSLLEVVEYRFYDALCHAAVHESTASEDREFHRARLAEHVEKLDALALVCPENFANRAVLIGAELARIESRDADAMRLYEQAVRSARDNGFVHNEALACETAARFYAARGFEDIAEMYLVKARDGYRRWGADGVVRRLEERYPHLAKADPSGAAGVPMPLDRQLDVAAIVKASQALSGEIMLPSLIERLMTIALQDAGAERGLLILVRDGEPRIEAEATTGVAEIKLQVRQSAITPSDLPRSVLHYALRTQERVLLDDASSDKLYSADEYVRAKRSRSVLCLPIVRQGKLVGALYLENSLVPGAFTPERVAVLELLASQAAISLENAALYTDLQRSEAFLAQGQRISHTGTFGWSVASGEFYWSAENYNILEYDRSVQASADLALQRMHPGDRDHVRQLLDDAMREKKDFDSEHRLLMPDGRVKHVHTTGRAVNTGSLDFVGAVRDITERVRSEKAARESERRYHEVQLQLAHANRVETLGHLSASIAHELNQPLSGAVLSAETGLLWLSGEQPNIPEAQKAFARVIRDGNRASEIFRRIRTLIKKAPTQKDRLDINQATLEIVGLTHGEAADNGVRVQTRLQEGLPLFQGDRVQLQQVILNLIMNALDAIGSRDTGPREILISTANTDSGDIHVSVQDSGPGVDPATIDRIFDAFYTTKADGLGMGLSICRSIIGAHGGKLWAATGIRRGAVFQFTVPVVEPDSA